MLTTIDHQGTHSAPGPVETHIVGSLYVNEVNVVEKLKAANEALEQLKEYVLNQDKTMQELTFEIKLLQDETRKQLGILSNRTLNQDIAKKDDQELPNEEKTGKHLGRPKKNLQEAESAKD